MLKTGSTLGADYMYTDHGQTRLKDEDGYGLLALQQRNLTEAIALLSSVASWQPEQSLH